MAGTRERHRKEVLARILAAARDEVATKGGGGLSVRAVAREVDLVSSALYRYFPTREALLTAMIVESYEHLATAVSAADGDGPAAAWRARASALRAWARAHPHEFQLVYGTPIPGYVAPPETIPAAAAVVGPFLVVGAARAVQPFDTAALVEQMAAVRELAPDADLSGAAAVLAELAALIGLVSLELAGHFVGSADPTDHLFTALVERQVATLGLT